MAVRSVDVFFCSSLTSAEASNRAQVRGAFSKAALALTVSAAALTLAQGAFAQETQLPGINVQGAQAKKSSAPKSKPKPKPVQTATPAPAAPPPPATDGGNQAAKIDAPYDTPAGVSVAGQGEIQTFGQTNVQDVLRAMPGVSTSDDPNNPGVAINIRGFEGEGRVNMSIDGVRQNFRITGHEAGGFAYVDPLLLASIDVQRGAVSTAGGAGALAGSADLRTLDVDDILKPGRNSGALVLSSWGSNNVGFSEMGAGAIRSGAVSVAGAISKHDVDDYDNGLGQRVPFTDQDLISGLAKVHVQIDPWQRISFGTVQYDNDFTADGYKQNINSQIYTANYVYKPGNDLVDFHANFYGSDLKMHYLDAVDPAQATSFFPSSGRQIDDVGLGFDVANTSLFDLGGIHVKSNYGYEYFHDDVDASNKLDPGQGGGVNPSGTSHIGGVFSQTTFSKSIFDFTVGLRYDSYAMNGSGVVPTPVPITFPDQNGNLITLNPHLPSFLKPGPYKVDNSDGGFSPKLTLAVKPVEWFQPYVTYSESFSAPTISETLTGGSHPGDPSEGLFLPNPFLQPEKQKGWEFGFNSKVDGLFQPGDAFRLKADYYRMDVDNYITADFDDTGIAIWFANNPGTSQVDGVELQGTYDAGYMFGGITYTHSHTELPPQVDGFGFHSFLPADVVTLTGGVRLFDQRLTVGARGYITSNSDIGKINVGGNEPSFADGYETVDLFSEYKVTDDLKVSLTVSNLTDVAYTPALSSGGTGPINLVTQATEGVPDDTGRGRTFLLTTKAQF